MTVESRTTWRAQLTDRMATNGETWDDVVHVSIPDGWLDREFEDDFGGAANGHPFTLWTRNRVYFPVKYDGSEWVRSVPRMPSAEMTRHVGGGVEFYLETEMPDGSTDMWEVGDKR